MTQANTYGETFSSVAFLKGNFSENLKFLDTYEFFFHKQEKNGVKNKYFFQTARKNQEKNVEKKQKRKSKVLLLPKATVSTLEFP